MTTAYDTSNFSSFCKQEFHDKTSSLIVATFACFQSIVRRQVLLGATFFCFAVFSILFFISSFSFLYDSFLLGIAVSIFFFATLIYFLLRIYLQQRKSRELKQLSEEFISTCKEMIQFRKGVAEFHLALAHATWRMAQALSDKELSLFRLPRYAKKFRPLVSTVIFWLFWKDVYYMKEMFLLLSIDEHIHLVKSEPTNLEFHAALANSYVMLATHYSTTKSGAQKEELYMQFSLSKKMLDELRRKFCIASKRAIEEFKILKSYAPDDPWVLAQLAFSYHDLQMPEQEISEYERMSQLNPYDKDILFRLGVLYFQQGENARGLKIFERLKSSNFKKAEELIEHYGAYRFTEQPTDDALL